MVVPSFAGRPAGESSKRRSLRLCHKRLPLDRRLALDHTLLQVTLANDNCGFFFSFRPALQISGAALVHSGV